MIPAVRVSSFLVISTKRSAWADGPKVYTSAVAMSDLKVGDILAEGFSLTGDYEKYIENMERGMFRMNWSIYEWEEARVGDMFYMMRVGDRKAGIVFSGIIVSNPYVMDDWAGTTKRRLYVDLVCMNAVAPGEKPMLSLDMLQTAIPEYNWAKGHSGVLIPDSVAEKIVGLMDKDAHVLN